MNLMLTYNATTPGVSACLIFAIIILNASCKRASVDFTTDKPEYFGGDTIHFKNTSQNADSYYWLFPDTTTSNSKDPVLILKMRTYGVKNVTLKANGKHGKEVSYTRPINVNRRIGSVVLWTTVQFR